MPAARLTYLTIALACFGFVQLIMVWVQLKLIVNELHRCLVAAGFFRLAQKAVGNSLTAHNH